MNFHDISIRSKLLIKKSWDYIKAVKYLRSVLLNRWAMSRKTT